MNFVEKLQNLPLSTKKIILWSVVGILGIGLLTWWITSIPKRIESFQKEQFLEEIAPPFQEKSENFQESEATSQEPESKFPSWEGIRESFKEIETELQKLENQKLEQ